MKKLLTTLLLTTSLIVSVQAADRYQAEFETIVQGIPKSCGNLLAYIDRLDKHYEEVAESIYKDMAENYLTRIAPMTRVTWSGPAYKNFPSPKEHDDKVLANLKKDAIRNANELKFRDLIRFLRPDEDDEEEYDSDEYEQED